MSAADLQASGAAVLGVALLMTAVPSVFMFAMLIRASRRGESLDDGMRVVRRSPLFLAVATVGAAGLLLSLTALLTGQVG